jgi:hypothetical protein
MAEYASVWYWQMAMYANLLGRRSVSADNNESLQDAGRSTSSPWQLIEA